MVFTKHLRYRRIIESITLFFFIYKTLKQINKTPIECSHERPNAFYQGEDIFSGIMNG